MDETYRWMVGRLEAELADARQEIRDLRTQLTAKDERIRESTVELARYETRQEALDDAPKKGLGDSFDPDKLVALADRFAPLIGAVTTALLDRGSRQQPTAVHFSSPYGYAQDYTATQPAGQRGTVQPINPSTPPFDDLPGITS